MQPQAAWSSRRLLGRSDGSDGLGALAQKTLESTDETFGFELPFETDHEQILQRFLESEGMEPGETIFMGFAGKKGLFMVVAEFGV
jgi:hypothetical protein